jgi:hypothetical protein
MLPNTIIGSVVTASGALPFSINTASGKVTTGRYQPADDMQANMGSMEKSAVDKQVRLHVSGAKAVRVGEYQCPKCERWVNVVKRPSDWSGDHCASH